MKSNSIIRIMARIVGLVVLILGIRMIAEGTLTYINQHKQTDWIVITAEVTDVSSRLRGSSSQHSQRNTVYDITYEYEVDGRIYSGEISSQPTPRLVGDEMKIKYNPDTPEESTTSLSPSTHDFLVFVIFGLVFSTLGFFLSGAFAFIRRQLGKSEPEEEKLPPEEYIATDNRETMRKPFTAPLVRRIALAALAIALILLSMKLFPGTKTVDAQTFGNAAEAAGYVVTDSTEKLRQEWRVGSMLTEAASFDNGKIRMDFCVMDTLDAAKNLYNGMTLPISGEEILELGGTVHELYSVENQTNFAAKIHIRDTVIYVYTLAEYKNEAIALLETIGYWKN